MWRTASALLGIVLILVALGVVMLTSTSAVHGSEQFGDSLFFVKKQAVALALALLAGFIAAKLDYRVWRRLTLPMAVVSVIFLILPLIPGIGLTIKGSSRWIRLGPVNFQPSELGKLTVILLLAAYISRYHRRMLEVKQGLLIPFMLWGLIAGLVFISPDFGTTLLIAIVSMLMMYVGGGRISHLLISGAIGLSLFALAIMENEVRMRRIIAFMNPDKVALGDGFQLVNSIYAFMVGGVQGVGLGQSLQKRFYLPESHTDFIYAIIGEELGLWASLAVVILFYGFFICGLRISRRAPDLYGKILGMGITLMITLQACVNIGVVTGALPTKGLPLPFISYGGSSILITMFMVGLLVSIARHADGELADV